MKTDYIQLQGKPIREPPGCPPGPPPIVNEDGEVMDYEILRGDEEEEESSNENNESDPNTSKPTSLQQKMVALSGQNIDEFMKEMESVQKRGDIGKDLQNSRKVVAHVEPLIPPGTDPSIVVAAPPNPPSMPVMFPSGGLR